MRTCTCCGEQKLIEDFPKQRTLCKVCHNKKTLPLKQKWKLLNPDKVLADRIRRSEIHKEIAKQHYQQNIELYKQKMRLYVQHVWLVSASPITWQTQRARACKRHDYSLNRSFKNIAFPYSHYCEADAIGVFLFSKR